MGAVWIHRDLKSANILLDEKMLPHVADFGLGKFANSGPEVTQAIGTIQWMAPEQVFSSNYGPPADVFAYGMILYELLTEKIPYEGLQTGQIYRVLSDRLRPQLPPELDGEPIVDLILHCWWDDPAGRPTFGEIFQMFEDELVSFPNTNPIGVRRLLHEIEHQQQEHTWLPNPASLVAQIEDIPPGRETVLDAAASGDIRLFAEKMMMSRSSNVAVCDGERGNALHCAIEASQADMVAFLCQLPDIDVNWLAPRGVTPLIMAIQVADLQIVKMLLRHKRIDVNLVDRPGDAPIHWAVKTGSADIMKALLAHPRIDREAKATSGKTALEIARDWEKAAIVALLERDPPLRR